LTNSENYDYGGVLISMQGKNQRLHERGMQIKEGRRIGSDRSQNSECGPTLKTFDVFFNREDIPWVGLIWESYYEAGSLPSMAKKGSFWWRDILKLLDKFKGMAMVCINSAISCYL
jgi:hypothetical protein